MVIVNYRNKKYSKYILVYIKVKIMETSKYGLSYMRYYIVITIRELYSYSCQRTYNNFLDHQMTLNEKVVNYKVLDLLILYNFGIKFDFIRNHMRKL